MNHGDRLAGASDPAPGWGRQPRTEAGHAHVIVNHGDRPTPY